MPRESAKIEFATWLPGSSLALLGHRLWSLDTRSGKLTKWIENPGAVELRCVFLGGSGHQQRTVLTTDAAGYIALWDKEGKLLQREKKAAEWIGDCSDARVFGRVRLGQASAAIATGQGVVLLRPGGARRVSSALELVRLSFSAKNDYLAICGGFPAGGVHCEIVDATTFKQTQRLVVSSFSDVSWAPRGSLFLLNKGENDLELWDASARKRLWRKPLQGGRWDETGKYAFVGGEKVGIIDVARGSDLARWESPLGCENTTRWSGAQVVHSKWF